MARSIEDYRRLLRTAQLMEDGQKIAYIQGRIAQLELEAREAQAQGAAAQPPPQEAAQDTGDLLVSGGRQALGALKASPDVLFGGDVTDQAKNIAASYAEQTRPQPKQLTEVKEAFRDEAAVFEDPEATGMQKLGATGGMLLEMGKQILTNPKGVWYFTAEQAGNMVPAIMGAYAGAKTGALAGGAVAGPAGALVGAVGGGFAGGFIGGLSVEAGAEFSGNVIKEVRRRGLPVTEENVAAVLSDKKFTDKAAGEARTKAVVLSAVDAAFSIGGARVAGAPRRAAIAAAKEQLGPAATTAQITKLVDEAMMARTVGQDARRGLAGIGVNVAGEGAGEAAGQKAAYGEIDPESVALETLGGIGGSAVETVGLARALREKVQGQQNPPANTAAGTPTQNVAPPDNPRKQLIDQTYTEIVRDRRRQLEIKQKLDTDKTLTARDQGSLRDEYDAAEKNIKDATKRLGEYGSDIDELDKAAQANVEAEAGVSTDTLLTDPTKAPPPGVEAGGQLDLPDVITEDPDAIEAAAAELDGTDRSQLPGTPITEEVFVDAAAKVRAANNGTRAGIQKLLGVDEKTAKLIEKELIDRSVIIPRPRNDPNAMPRVLSPEEAAARLAENSAPESTGPSPATGDAVASPPPTASAATPVQEAPPGVTDAVQVTGQEAPPPPPPATNAAANAAPGAAPVNTGYNARQRREARAAEAARLETLRAALPQDQRDLTQQLVDRLKLKQGKHGWTDWKDVPLVRLLRDMTKNGVVWDPAAQADVAELLAAPVGSATQRSKTQKEAQKKADAAAAEKVRQQEDDRRRELNVAETTAYNAQRRQRRFNEEAGGSRVSSELYKEALAFLKTRARNAFYEIPLLREFRQSVSAIRDPLDYLALMQKLEADKIVTPLTAEKNYRELTDDYLVSLKLPPRGNKTAKTRTYNTKASRKMEDAAAPVVTGEADPLYKKLRTLRVLANGVGPAAPAMKLPESSPYRPFTTREYNALIAELNEMEKAKATADKRAEVRLGIEARLSELERSVNEKVTVRNRVAKSMAQAEEAAKKEAQSRVVETEQARKEAGITGKRRTDAQQVEAEKATAEEEIAEAVESAVETVNLSGLGTVQRANADVPTEAQTQLARKPELENVNATEDLVGTTTEADTATTTPAKSRKKAKNENPDVNEVTGKDFVDATDGKTLVELATYLAEEAESNAVKAVARHVKQVLERLESVAGVKFGPLTYDSKIRTAGKAIINWQADPEIDPGTGNLGVDVVLHPKNGSNPTIALHELVHAVIQPLREIGLGHVRIGRNSKLAKLMHQYDDFADRVMKAMTPEAIKEFGIEDAASGIFKKKRAGGFHKLPDEVLPYALSDPNFQRFLESLPSPNPKNGLFGTFVKWVREMLGLPAGAETELTEALRITEQLTSDGAINEIQVENIARREEDQKAPLTYSLAAKRNTPGQKLKAPPPAKRTVGQVLADGSKVFWKYLKKRPTFRQFWQATFKYDTYSKLVREVQNDRRLGYELQQQLWLSDLLIYTRNADPLKSFNNFMDHITNSSGIARRLVSSVFDPDFAAFEQAVRKLSAETGMDVKEAAVLVDRTMMMLHAKERRRTLFALNVPLDDDNKVFSITTVDKTGKVQKTKVGAATLREMIWEKMHNKTSFANAAEKKAFEDLIEKTYRPLLYKITEPGSKYLKPEGRSLEDYGKNASSKPAPVDPDIINIDNERYQVFGDIHPDEYQDFKDIYDNGYLKNGTRVGKGAIQDAIKTMRRIQDETERLNIEANFWSQGVSNIKRLYGWENYVPYKGIVSNVTREQMMDYGGPRYSPEFKNEVAVGFSGRTEEGTPPVIQIQMDAVRAAMRVAQSEARGATRNAIQQGHIESKEKTKPKLIKFSDRAKELSKELTLGNDKFIYYNDDGSIEVYTLTKKEQKEMLQRAYSQDDEFVQAFFGAVGAATAFIGKQFTRFNLSFGLKNFVRDIFTNAGVLSAEKGALVGFKYLGAVSARVARLGFVHTHRAAKLYANGDIATLEKLANDPKTAYQYRSAYEFLMSGGAVTYVQSFAREALPEEIVNRYGKGKGALGNLLRAAKREQLDKFFDNWAMMFELSARVAAYDIHKSEVKRELIGKGIAPAEAEAAARVNATAYTKNLINFEQVGRIGKTLGSLFMFFRPTATGAVRTLDAIAPLLRSDMTTLLNRLPEKVQKDPVAMAAAMKKIKQQKRNATMTSVLFASMGFMSYMMARMMGGEDDEERNAVAYDNKELWTRNLRIPMSFFGFGDDEKDFYQIPWGFGLGALMSSGAQVAAFAAGDQGGRQMMGNIMSIGADTYLPLPVAQFNPFDSTSDRSAAEMSVWWLLDSASPTVARPLVEYFVNINGLGQEIYKANSHNKYGDAYRAVDRVPEVYNDLAQFIEEITAKAAGEDNAIDIEPELYHYFLTNYASGLVNGVSSVYGLSAWMMDKKDFEPKRDSILFSGFFGRQPSPDATKFARYERQVMDLQQRITKLQNLKDPIRYADYLVSNPRSLDIVDAYKAYKTQIDQVRETMNKIRDGKLGEMTPGMRKELIRQEEKRLNRLKGSFVTVYRAYMADQNRYLPEK
jgi:hypothetical protein